MNDELRLEIRMHGGEVEDEAEVATVKDLPLLMSLNR